MYSIAQKITWTDNCSSEQHFRIERKKDGQSFEIIAQVGSNDTTYIDYDADFDQHAFSYRISAITINGDALSSETVNTSTKTSVSKEIYPHLLYVPDDYSQDSTDTFPLMIFLHGAGERGANIELVNVHGPPKLVKDGQSFPCLIVSPQCPLERAWNTERLDTLLSKIKRDYRVDDHRIYLTGLSMGGYGTWNWSIQRPELFAAIAPICGGGDPKQAKAIRNLPIWVFHGADDTVVPLSESQDMVDALASLDVDVTFTIYPDTGHNSWTETYNNPDFYDWLFSQHK